MRPDSSLDPLRDALAWVGPSGRRAGEFQRLLAALGAAEERPLLAPRAPRAPGIYVLYVEGHRTPVYVGKTEARLGLSGRLAQHVRTLHYHQGIDARDVRCRFVVYGPRAPLRWLEATLIRYYRPLWNELIGFGSGRAPRELPPVGRWEDHYPRRHTDEPIRLGAGRRLL